MKMEYVFIKQKDDYCVTEEMFRNFLCGNKRIEFKDIEDNKASVIVFDGQNLEYGLESADVEKSNEMIFHLMVDIQGNGENQANILESFDSLIKEINEKSGEQFSVNTIWNDVSAYYGKKLYPEILKVENMLRKIIYLFMLKTVGSKWIDIGAPEKFQISINSVIEKNNKAKNEINAEWLTYADFITLAYFFTAPYSLKTDLEDLFKELKQYECNNALSDREKQANIDIVKEKKEKKKPLTTEVIRKMSDEYEPKNNWDRYFSDKLKVNGPKKFSKDWSSLYDIRNKVAHGKPINEADFKKANELVKLFTTTFDECIEIIDTLEITVEEAEAVEAVAQQVLQKEQTDAFKRQNFSAEIKQYPYGVKLNSENLLDRAKILQDTIKSSEAHSVSDSVLGLANVLSSAFSNLSDTSGLASVVQGIGPTLSAFAKGNGLAIGKEPIGEVLSPLSLQTTILPKYNESLKAEKIMAALDKPITIDSSIYKMGLNEKINVETKLKTDFLGTKATDAQIKVSNPEKQEQGKE